MASNGRKSFGLDGHISVETVEGLREERFDQLRFADPYPQRLAEGSMQSLEKRKGTCINGAAHVTQRIRTFTLSASACDR